MCVRCRITHASTTHPLIRSPAYRLTPRLLAVHASHHPPSPARQDLAEQLRLPDSCILRHSLSRTDHTAAIVTLLLLPRYQPTFPRSFLVQVDSRMRRHQIHLDARLYGEYSLVAITQLLPPLAPPSLPAPLPPPVPGPPAPGNSGSSSGGGGGGGYTTSDASGNSNVVDSASGSSSSSSSSSNSTSSKGGSSPSPGGVANYSGSSSNSLGSGTATGGVGAQAQAGGNSAGENGSEQQGMSVNMVVLLVVGAVAVTAVGNPTHAHLSPSPTPVVTRAAEAEVVMKGKGSSSDLLHPIHPANEDEHAHGDGDAYADCCPASSTGGLTAGAAGAYRRMGVSEDGADTRADPGDDRVPAAVSATPLPAAGQGCGQGSEANSDGGVAGGSGKGGLGGLSGVREFSLQEMALATNSFHESSVLGEGGFGRVYRGTIPPSPHSTSSSSPAAPIEVAIKRMDRGRGQGDREFLVEVEVLSRLHHRHLVKLLGYCVVPGEHMLCYELLPNGSLHSWLHGPHSHAAFLDWPARVSIAVGAARGLAYLHEGSQPAVIHRDVKPSNVLLDARMSPKLADFGLAKAAPQGVDEHVSTRVMGTFGYVAPEYAMTGHLMVPSDVYSFGVVLLELLSGRKAVDTSRPLGQESLVLWARPLLAKPSRYHHLLDPRLLACPSPPPPAALHTVAALAHACVHSDPAARPSMSTVVELLRRAQQTSNADQKQPSFASQLSMDTLCMASPCVQEQGGPIMRDSNPDSILAPHSPRCDSSAPALPGLATSPPGSASTLPCFPPGSSLMDSSQVTRSRSSRDSRRDPSAASSRRNNGNPPVARSRSSRSSRNSGTGVCPLPTAGSQLPPRAHCDLGRTQHRDTGTLLDGAEISDPDLEDTATSAPTHAMVEADRDLHPASSAQNGVLAAAPLAHSLAVAGATSAAELSAAGSCTVRAALQESPASVIESGPHFSPYLHDQPTPGEGSPA
ncbi:unnamed protein product [Closterium sp. Naga37s-1]|nr:unnamed protein product [Closterium sp. Naga37s-1]